MNRKIQSVRTSKIHIYKKELLENSSFLISIKHFVKDIISLLFYQFPYKGEVPPELLHFRQLAGSFQV